MAPIHCKKCGRMLMKGEIKKIEIVCPKCGYKQIIENQKKSLTHTYGNEYNKTTQNVV